MMKKTFPRPTLMLSAILFAGSLSAQTWSQKADVADCRYDGVTFAIDNKVYYGSGITCGGTLSNAFRVFDPVANTWSSIAPLPGSTRRIASSFAINGKGYVIGGISQMGTALPDVWEYDPVADTWTQKNNFTGPARGSTADFVVNGKGYICGGVANPYTYRDLWEYDPVADAWLQRADFAGSWIFQASGFTIGAYGYVVFGRDDLGIALKELLRYDPVANTWLQKANFPGEGRTDASAFAINGTGYAGFGGEGVTYFGDFYSYSASTDQWTALVGIPGAPAYYDGYVATATAGYCLMRISANYDLDTWEFAPGGSTSVDENLGAGAFSVHQSGPGEVVVVTGADAAGFVKVVGVDGKLVRTLRVGAWDRARIQLPTGSYVFRMEGSQYVVKVAVMD